jgi:phage tail-like protein
VSADGFWRYLNLEADRWPLVLADGVEVAPDGSLALGPLPSFADALGGPTLLPGVLEGPAGIAVAPDGTVYVSDPMHHLLLRLELCGDALTPVACHDGPSDEPGRFDGPRGLAVGRHGILYVADSGNGRVQLLDLETGQVRGIWDHFSDTRLNTPWDLAEDRQGRIYLTDAGTAGAGGQRSGGAVYRYAPGGAPDLEFATTLASQATTPGAPVGVALLAGSDPDDERLLVLDASPTRVLVYRLDGTADAAGTARWQAAAAQLSEPAAIAARGGRLYVADARAGLLVFGAGGTFLGRAADHAAALALDCDGFMYLHPGGAGGLVRRASEARPTACGAFLLGPLRGEEDRTRWRGLEAALDGVGPDAQLRLFTLTSARLDGGAGGRPDLPAECDAAGAGFDPAEQIAPTALDVWRAGVWNAESAGIHSVAGRYLWLAGQFIAEAGRMPRLRQVRVSWGGQGWMRHLPALYARPESQPLTMQRLLSLFEYDYATLERLVEGLAARIDPRATPDLPPSAGWLDWLGDWVGVTLETRWDAALRRETVAGAFERHGRRGTPGHLRERLAREAGVPAAIEELGLRAGPWALGVTGGLGFDTLLPPASDGAVLDIAAATEDSAVLPADQRGRALLQDVAYRFRVVILGGPARDPAAVARARGLLDREKPAHTEYELCLVPDGMRVGDARVGLETMVGDDGPRRPPARRLGDAARIGTDAILA